ncbi:TetR family transcriptional regulator [Pseudomonas putida]|uniref:TetR family transcriptional regulator n=1 Tax=Pseudomonas putida TaxID=303 RepID=UPI0039067973
MARKTAAQAALTRQSILAAATELFSQAGVAETTLEQIAQRANVTRGAIYWHFRGKEDLLKTIFDEQTLPLESKVPNDLPLSLAWQQLQHRLVETISEENPRRLAEIMMYQGACGGQSAVHQQRLVNVRVRFMQHLQTLLENAVSAGELAASLNIRRVMEFFGVSTTGLLFDCLQKEDNPIGSVHSTLNVLWHVLMNPPEIFLVQD